MRREQGRDPSGYIDDHLDEHVAHIQSWVRQTSVSWDNLGVGDCAELVARVVSRPGLPGGRDHRGALPPRRLGPLRRRRAGHRPQLLHVRHAHRRPRRMAARPLGRRAGAAGLRTPRCWSGRGAMGAKGPYVAFLNALAAIIAVEGTLPVNIMFLAEGEEIMGSPTYREFVERYRDRLKTVSASFCPTRRRARPASVTVGLGLKGMVVLELTASGEAWGHGPEATIHARWRGLVSSPPFRLAQGAGLLWSTRMARAARSTELQASSGTHRKPLEAGKRSCSTRIAERAGGKDWRDVLPLGGAGNVAGMSSGGLAGIDPLINLPLRPDLQHRRACAAASWAPGHGDDPLHRPGPAPRRRSTCAWSWTSSAEEIIDSIRRHLDRNGFADIAIDVFAAFDALADVHCPTRRAGGAADARARWTSTTTSGRSRAAAGRGPSCPTRSACPACAAASSAAAPRRRSTSTW